MRTLASTFSTREEAEAALRHLESIGITRERIVFKDVAQAGEGPAAAGNQGAGSSGRAFISVKVTTDQVERASEILKGGWRTKEEAAAPGMAGRPLGNVQGAGAGAGAGAGGSVPPWPLPAQEPGPAPGPPGEGAATELWARSRDTRDRARRSRYLIFFSLALVGAFMIGAWLGLAS